MSPSLRRALPAALILATAPAFAAAGNAPDRELLAIEKTIAAGDRAGATKTLAALRETYPDDRRLAGLAALLADDTVVFVVAPVRLATRPAAEQVALRLLERRFLALEKTPADTALKEAAAIREKLDPLLERTPGLVEGAVLRARLAVVESDDRRGRDAARLLDAWGLRRAASSPETVALVGILDAKGWFAPGPGAR